MVEDHAQLITYHKAQSRQREIEKIAAVLPLLKIVLDIDNSNPQ
jgi:hypothetical protein